MFSGERALAEQDEGTFSGAFLFGNDGQLLEILRSEAARAAELGRQPYVEFYADWCPPCNAIRESLSDERMVAAFRGTYIIKLDFDYWKNRLSGTGLHVPGIPAFFEIDKEGLPTGQMITGAAWGQDIPENIAPPMKEFFSAEEGTGKMRVTKPALFSLLPTPYNNAHVVIPLQCAYQ